VNEDVFPLISRCAFEQNTL